MRVFDNFLRASAIFWFVIAMAGQWAFFYYIVAFYGNSIISNNLEVWNRMEPLGNTPYILGDIGGNLAFAAHALGAGIVAFGGALQLIPQIRQRAPNFHRWNGRIFITTVVALALSGFYLVWIRGASPNSLTAFATTVLGLMIFVFAGVAFYRIRSGDIRSHRQWALRLYLVSNAQWFLRVGVFSYLIVGRALGMKPDLSGWFFDFWHFGSYLVPLVVLQLYLVASNTTNSVIRIMASFTLIVFTLLMGVGIVGFTFFTQAIIIGAPLTI